MRLLLVLCLCAAAVGAADKFGKGLTLKSATPIAEILDSPDAHVGKMVQVKGTVTEVCQMMGCWLQIQDGAKAIRFKVKDGEILFPKDGAGRKVTAEGILKKIDLNHQQAIAWAKHEAEERGQKLDPSKVKGGMTIYQIQGTGAVLGE